MSKSSRSNGPALNRRELLRLSTAAGVGAVMPTYGAFAAMKDGRVDVAAGTCSTPRSAVARTQYGKVRGYVEDGVLTFKGVPYGAPTGGEHRWLPAKAPTPWEGEYPALIYGANCPQRLHDWVSEQTFLFQWTDGWQSEDMLKVNIWTSSLTGRRPVMFYIHGGGYTFGSAYELASQDGAQMARHHDRLTRDRRTMEIPWIGYLALVSCVDPDPAENSLHLQLEDLWVGVNATMDAIVAHQASEVLIRIRCHEGRCHVSNSTANSSNRRDCLDLDQELFADQPIDHQQRIGRILTARIYPGEEFLANRHERFDVLRMHEVGGEFGDIGEAKPFGFKCVPQIVEDLAHLGREVAFANQFPGFVDCELAGDE